MKKIRPTQIVCFGAGEMQGHGEQQDVGREEAVGERDEAAARQLLHEIGEGEIDEHHAGERAEEQPGQIFHAARDPHLIADRAHDVIGGQHRENVEPAPGNGAHFLGPHRDEPLQQPVSGARGRRRDGGRRIDRGHRRPLMSRLTRASRRSRESRPAYARRRAAFPARDTCPSRGRRRAPARSRSP